MRERCYQCFRPLPLCYCRAVPEIDNRTDVLILQHVRERWHPFNTARIVRHALRRCELIVDANKRLGSHRLPIAADAGLLYPRSDAPCLSELSPSDRPGQLVVIDGTWHQAKTIVRDVPQLTRLPCFRLSPAEPSQYRIRREPDERSLSTLEATVAALRALEPDTKGLDQLLQAFNTMVENQLSHRGTRIARRKRMARNARPRNIPAALLDDAKHLVVAYGEATPRSPGLHRTMPSPVNWVAQRLESSERFSCCLRQTTPLPKTALEHMQLNAADFVDALTPREFNNHWNQFIRPNDVLIVYHERTSRLLQQVAPSQTRSLVLKAIFGQREVEFHSLEELLELQGLSCPSFNIGSRADQRLEMAVQLVQHVRMKSRSLAEW